MHEYLSTHFKGEAGQADQFEQRDADRARERHGFLRKESATWIAYRTKKGPCKTLDDLKKVPGVDFKKVDQRRERLVCIG